VQPPTSVELARRLEEFAFRAWPASEVQDLDGWRLRCHDGVTRRANSAWPNGQGALPAEEKLPLVEQFYARRGLPARYQISPAARPADLDETLARRGYAVEAPTSVQTAALAEVLSRMSAEPAVDVRIAAALDEDWLATYCGAEGASQRERAGRRGILSRIAAQTGFALYSAEGRPASAGLGVLEGGWMGLFCMATRPEYRRRGAATAVLSALARWGLEHGATRAYLQVMEDNSAARALYARAGFATLYGYHYRTKQVPPAR
jgi:N-acetylglutamate synthase